MKKIYIAAKFSDRKRLRTWLPRLEYEGFKVVSRWITDDDHDFNQVTATEREDLALRDIMDIERADLIVLDTLGGLSEGAGGGREFEAGYGMAYHKKPFCRVGPARSVFHTLAEQTFKLWEDFCDGR